MNYRSYFEKGREGLKQFLKGLAWPFTRLESGTANVGLICALLLIIALGTLAGLTALAYVIPDFGGSTDQPKNGYSSSNLSDSGDTGNSNNDDPNCNVAGIELYGCLMTYAPGTAASDSSSSDSCDTITSSDDVMSILDSVASDSRYKGVLVEIDSPGGSPVGGEEIADALKNLGKPSVAWIRGQGDSAAYWAATGADTIVASANSDVGSIGATYSYTDESKQDTKEGITFNQLSSGAFKDTGNPDKPLTADERALIMRDINITAQNFIQDVATNRNLSVAKVSALADGSSMLGQAAKQNGLVDSIGTEKQAMDAVQKAIKGKPDVCWLGPSH